MKCMYTAHHDVKVGCLEQSVAEQLHLPVHRGLTWPPSPCGSGQLGLEEGGTNVA